MSRRDAAVQQNRDDGKTRFVFLVIIIVTLLCFLPDIYNDLLLTWDDGATIINNEHIRHLNFDTLLWAFSDFYCSDWLPLVWISFALEYAVWGLNPAGYHLTNNIIHALNAGMIFLLFLELLRVYIALNRTDNAKSSMLSGNGAIFCALLAALLFAIHPLRVEAVAWATGRKDVLSLFFGLPAVLAYLQHAQVSITRTQNTAHPLSFTTTAFYWPSVVLYCLSLFSKPMLVTLPLILLVLDWYPLERFNRQDIKGLLLEKTPYAICAGFISVIIMNAHAGAVMPMSESNMLSRALIAIKSIMSYIYVTLWPIELSPFYLHPLNVSMLTREYAIPVLFLTAFTLCAALLIKRQPVLISAWLIYLLTLIPVLGFTQVSLTAMADRYTYVPGIPISLLCALGLTALLARLSDFRYLTYAVRTGILLMLLTGIYLTERQITFWKDDVALWSRAIDVQPHFSGKMYFQRSMAFTLKGEHQKALADINEALAIATRKNNRIAMREVVATRARILNQLRDLDGAIADYTSAIALDNAPERSAYFFERGNIYLEMGRIDLANEDFRLARMIDGNK